MVVFLVEVKSYVLKEIGFKNVQQLTPIKKRFYIEDLKLKKKVQRIHSIKNFTM